MKVNECMTQTLERIQADAPISEAARLMDGHDIGCLAVQQDSQIVGVVSDRDIVVRSLAGEGDPKQLQVSQVMTTEPVTCSESDDVQTVAQRMKEKKVRRLIVLDVDGNPVGMVTLGDIAARGHQTESAGTVMEEVCSAP